MVGAFNEIYFMIILDEKNRHSFKINKAKNGNEENKINVRTNRVCTNLICMKFNKMKFT